MKRHIALKEIVAVRNYKTHDMKLKTFRFNPIQVNTYVLHDENRQALIIDPGNYVPAENEELLAYIRQEELVPVAVVNTHPHIDHIVGNRFCIEQFHCPLLMHEKALGIYHKAHVYAAAFGFDWQEAPEPSALLHEGDAVRYGKEQLKVLYTPGHAEGSICLYDDQNQMVFVGDVLFAGSVGRSDLPTGSQSLLLQSISTKLLTLPDATNVFCGHEIATTVGNEKLYNPFIQK